MTRHALQARAHMLVLKEVRAGRLAPIRTQRCTDCGKRAAHYDHRDYREPLKVEPVCHRCNVRRAPAAPAKRGREPSLMIVIRVKPEQLARYRAAAAKAYYSQMAPFVRFALSQLADRILGEAAA